jgi:hypothetical protein
MSALKRFRVWANRRISAGGPLDGEEEDRGEEDAEQRDAEHAGEDGGAEGAAHFRPGPLGDEERDDAEDEGDRGHDDRPEPELAGVEDGLLPGRPGDVPGTGELDDQDRVLAGEADEDHEADLGEDVDVQLRA